MPKRICPVSNMAVREMIRQIIEHLILFRTVYDIFRGYIQLSVECFIFVVVVEFITFTRKIYIGEGWLVDKRI